MARIFLSTLRGATIQVVVAGLVDEVHRDREIREYLPDPPNVVAYLSGNRAGRPRPGPGSGKWWSSGGMVQEELQELRAITKSSQGWNSRFVRATSLP